MSERLEVHGASGQSYIYCHLPADKLPPFQGANLIVAERRRGRWRLLRVSHTDYMPRRDWREMLEEVRAQVPGAELFYRLNVSHVVRLAEVDDVRGQLDFEERAIAA